MSSTALNIVREASLRVANSLADFEQGVTLIRPFPDTSHYGEEQCCKGAVIGAIERLYLSESFPAEAELTSPCRVGTLAVDAIITVVRCAPRGDRTGLIAPAAMTEAAVQVWADAQAAWKALRCYLGDVEIEDINFEWGIRDQTARPDEEGCVGTDLRFTFGLLMDCTPCG